MKHYRFTQYDEPVICTICGLKMFHVNDTTARCQNGHERHVPWEDDPEETIEDAMDALKRSIDKMMTEG